MAKEIVLFECEEWKDLQGVSEMTMVILTINYFALVLILGIIAGTYSSLFLVSPILVTWLEWRRK